MRIRVRLFASLRELAGRPEVSLELPEGASTEEAWRALARDFPALAGKRANLAASVNRRYATFDTPLAPEGDEVVFIPPVSGG